ncbi:MAG: hypothetical protein PHR77_12895 [Kiritimatiellae bacterium]|nr:hypothetical protein [Kiritimatiellia bacterium]MDD5521102.1 hypothetical protein [Kiritimatiellia bacterium]
MVEVLNRPSFESDRILFPFFSWRLFPYGAITLLLLLLGVFIFSDQQVKRTGNSIAVAVIDPMTEINEKRNYIDSGIRNFRKQYLTARDTRSFDERADKIRKQIELYSTALEEELGKTVNGKEKQNNHGKTTEGVNLQQGGIKDEYTA